MHLKTSYFLGQGTRLIILNSSHELFIITYKTVLTCQLVRYSVELKRRIITSLLLFQYPVPFIQVFIEGLLQNHRGILI